MRRFMLLIAAVALFGLLANPAHADLTDVQINSMTGGFEFVTCSVSVAESWDCTDSGFKIRSIPPTWNPTFADTCIAVNNYSEGGQSYTTCSVQNGSNNNARPTVRTIGSECGRAEANPLELNSWSLTWSGTYAAYYRDATGNSYRLTSFNLSTVAGSYANDGAVDSWDVTVTMGGFTTDFLGQTHTINFTLGGTVLATANCGGGSTVRNFSFSLSGVAQVN